LSNFSKKYSGYGLAGVRYNFLSVQGAKKRNSAKFESKKQTLINQQQTQKNRFQIFDEDKLSV